MNRLLNIHNDIVIDGEFYPYYDSDYWTGQLDEPTFPTESCVGTIFIDDNMDENLRQSCFIELNPRERQGDVIRDSSGNGNLGVLIGDYKIDKPSKDIPIRRQTEPNIPESDSTDGAM